jgi:hypothetical protein
MLMLPCPCSAPAQRPAAAARRTALGAPQARRRPAPVPCPTPWEEGYCQPQTTNPVPEWDSYLPLYICACPGHQPQNIIHTVFAFRRDPGRKHPPAFFSPKNFQTKKPAWVAGGVGLGPWRRRGWCRRTPGRVARLPMPLPPSPLLTLGCPLCGP